ncbi:MAG: putative oxidoreductase, Gfo/Idh/MocA family, partial [Bacillales bacterium]|nr:putative oxidoreductase, Gfo/Idh/MocA family [Bacillales bacterium]
THYAIVKECLEAGKDVYVDKPLAETVEQAEELVQIAETQNRRLMVGFNRRFSPLYNELKENSSSATSYRIEKHRMDNVGPQDWIFTMFDDYLHLVDTARWLSGDELKMVYNKVVVANDGNLLSAHHVFETPKMITITTEMHRNAGTRLEEVAAITDGQIIRVKNLNTIEYEKENKLFVQNPDEKQSDNFYRGFEDCIQYFIDCVANDKMPVVDGFEALKSQQLVADIINSFPKRDFC